jgi:cytochrome c peroxidase
LIVGERELLMDVRRSFATLSTFVLGGAVFAAALTPHIPPAVAASTTTTPAEIADTSGTYHTISSTGTIVTSGPFFQPEGTNRRACSTCHQPKVGWTITPASVQAVFTATQGTDPLFRTVDGAVSPRANVSTLTARRRAYSLLLSKALFRIHTGMPTGADFTLTSITDPYGYASSNDLSLFRRPLPATNLPFLTNVMWDGRETLAGETLPADLLDQAETAVSTHEQGMTGVTVDTATLQSIVLFEASLTTAQTYDKAAGWLNQNGGLGGSENLAAQAFVPGANDPAAPGFNPNVFTLYTAWAPAGPPPKNQTALQAAQASVGRGEQIFNTRPIQITGVAGLNDVLGQPTVRGTCTTCHSTPNVGNHPTPFLVDIGISAGARRTADLPLYVFRNNANGQTISTSDPGAALISGKWADMDKFKVPTLRGLATRAPYFHNGSAATVNDVVTFYDTRFQLGLNPQEKTDLAAFLRTL